MSINETERPMPLTFDAFRVANIVRCAKWHPQGIDSWSPSDWMTAVTGELGELASLLKMRNRERDGLPGNKFSPTHKQIADELADVLTYLDLLAHVLGVDLGRAAAQKFNEVSERIGFPDRIDLSPQVTDDTSRLDWLMRNVSGKELQRLGIITSAGCTREDIDRRSVDDPHGSAELSMSDIEDIWTETMGQKR